ncbi:MAG: FkbM family methyltransferase, partial [Vulcanimicrobiaceae bacterium]
VTTLDAEIDRLRWPSVDFVKIDAEGYDFRILRGARESLDAKRIALVQFEYNRAWQLAGDTLFGAFSFLKERGYATYLLKREGLFTLNYALYEEYFEYSNYVAVSPQHFHVIEPFVCGTI